MRRLLPAVLLFLATHSCHAGGWHNFPFKGPDLPAPPQQGTPWTPPKTDIPGPVVDAFAEVFKQGLPDPRGCEYRSAGVDGGQENMTGNQTVKIHGWIFADKQGEKFVITLDGLIKPALDVGDPADLHADIAALIDMDKKDIETQKAQAAAQAAAQPNAPAWSPSRITWAGSWDLFVNPRQQMSATTVALLLVIGENDLASKYWAQWSSIPDHANAKAPYLRYAFNWMEAMQGQMEGAFVAGDDHLSAAVGHRLAAVRKAYAAELDAHRADLAQGENYSPPAFFDSFLVEVERRAAEPAYTPLFISPGTARGPERIKLLIRDLEEVKPFAWINGSASLSTEDPTIAALVKEGDAAVEPLLECYEKDNRNIRILSSGNFGSGSYMIGVSDAAYTALTAILKTDFYVRWREPKLTREQIAARIRAYVKQYAGLSPAERWFTILADDNASDRWAEAANGIAFPVSMEKNYQASQTNWNPVKPDENPPLLGDPLRDKKSPSVSDLLLKRLTSVEKRLEGTLDHDLWNKTLSQHQVIARALAIWDGRAHLDELRKVAEICRENDSSIEFRSWLCERRVALGDTHALEEYAAWLGDTSPGEFALGSEHSHDLGCVFEPAWLHPDSPVVQKAITTIFSGSGGAWSPVWSPEHFYVRDLIYSPLAGFPGFRQDLLRGLGDKSSLSTITVKDGSATMTIRLGGEERFGVDKADPLLPPAGQSVPFRTCDLYAFFLADLPGAPECELYWPEVKRDEAVAACVKYLEDYGPNLGWDRAQNFIPPGGIPHASIFFPKLDHPATEDDVKQHRAIFALDGERRVLKMPPFPIIAFWRPHGIGPAVLRTRHGWPHSQDNIAIGTVWQAEEKLVDGKWERWFGFAGDGRVARVPASDIEFILKDDPNPDNRGSADSKHWMLNTWYAREDGIDTLIGDPAAKWDYRGGFGQSNHPNFINVPVGKTTVAFSIRNRTTADLSLPGVFFQDESNRKQLPPSVKVTLAAAEITPAWPDLTKPFDLEKIPWKEIPIRDGSYGKDDPAAKPVLIGPAGECGVFQIEMRDFFAMLPHAFYKLTVSYTIPGHGPQQTQSVEFLIGTSPWDAVPASSLSSPGEVEESHP